MCYLSFQKLHGLALNLTPASDPLLCYFSQGVLSRSRWLKIIRPTDSTDLLSGHICSRFGVFIQNSSAFQRSLELRGLGIAYNAFCMPLKCLGCV